MRERTRVRLMTVRLTEKEWNFIESVSRSTQKSRSDVVRSAIALLQFYYNPPDFIRAQVGVLASALGIEVPGSEAGTKIRLKPSLLE